MVKTFTFVSGLLGVLFFNTTLFAQTSTVWTGLLGSSWNTALNWSNGVPTSTSTAVIDRLMLNVATLPGNVTVANLTINNNLLGLPVGVNNNSLDLNGGTITVTGTCTIGSETAIKGNGGITAATITVTGCIFRGKVNLTKSGSSTDAWAGGNTFSDSTNITVSGTGSLNLCNTTVNDYNHSVRFAITNTNGNLTPCDLSGNHTFARMVTVSSVRPNHFSFGIGTLVFDNNNQYGALINANSDPTKELFIRNYTINKTGNVTLKGRIRITNNMTLTAGRTLLADGAIVKLLNSSSSSNNQYLC